MGASWATHYATRDATGLESEASILSIRVTKLFLGPPFLNNPRTCISNRAKKSSLDVSCSQLEERDHQALITSLRAPLNRPTRAVHGGIRIVGCRSCGPVLGIPARNTIARNSKRRERTLRIHSVSNSNHTKPAQTLPSNRWQAANVVHHGGTYPVGGGAPVRLYGSG